MDTLILEVEPRDETGKGSARRARRAGKLPAIFYGPAIPSRAISVNSHDLAERITRLEGTHLIQLRSRVPELDQKMVLLRDLQSDPVHGTPVHADFYEVALDKAIEVKVPLHFTGKALGVTLGGILQPVIRELTVSCLPTAIPEHIDVDVSELPIHGAVHIADIKLPDGVSAVYEMNDAVVTVLPPTVEEKPVAAEAEATAEEAAAAPGATAEGAEKKVEPGKPEAKKPEAKK